MKISLIKQGTILYPYGEEDIKKLEKFSNAIYEVDMKNLDTRTAAQNRALHMWCDRIATLLNTKGLFMKGVFGNNIEWTMELVKTQSELHDKAETKRDRSIDRLRDNRFCQKGHNDTDVSVKRTLGG